MFGSIGVFEMMLIAGVALMILGPEKFPEFAKMAARFVRDIRSYANEVQREVAKEIKPLTKDLEDLRRVNPEKYLEKLAGDEDEEDDKMKNTPPNPEPHPSEMGYGPDETTPAPEPEPPSEPTSETQDSSTVPHGQGGPDPYPHEDDPESQVPPSAERLDG